MKQTISATLLLILGLSQMIGDLGNFGALKAVAAATGASPAPKVFSAVRGLETFSSLFFIEWQDTQGASHSTRITPELNSQIRGPYNRRNVFGAALSFGPILASNEHTAPMFFSVCRYAFCGEAALLRELGIDPDNVDGNLRVRVVPQSNTKPDPELILVIEIERE